jgi:hypothetical protein
MTIHGDSLLLGILIGSVATLAVDRFVLLPLANLLERVERRWHGRLRAR